MKKYVLYLILAAFSVPSFALAAGSISPATYINDGAGVSQELLVTISGIEAMGGVYIFSATDGTLNTDGAFVGSYLIDGEYDVGPLLDWADPSYGAKFVFATDVSTADADCNGTDLATCEATASYSNTATLTAEPSPAGGGDGGNIIAMIEDSETVFASTTGFGLAAAVAWAGDSLVKVWLGSMLAILYNLRYWLVAALIIATIIGFAYRAFRFFRH